ncbi:MAG: hypothetical protein AAGA66_20135 [Bacteroidota bacterium]
MKTENHIKQHGEFIKLQREASRRLKITESIQAIILPAYIILGIIGFALSLKVFGVL